ncbi:MAG: type II secretion system protein E [Halobacteriovoraceae bacterium]|nr:type II secretion system protein E [Halobacteriovoraceae bacterium]|tara:strand:- start:16886 stop:17920 length:1035 start_codon:yes stop_codon:yes gene_type:complete
MNQNTVWALLRDLEKKKGISEVIINSDTHVYIERAGDLIRLNVQLNKNDIIYFCDDVAKLNQVHYDINNPIIDGNLPDGSRINIISSEYTRSLPAITIRKYSADFTRLNELEGKFGLTDKWVSFFQAIVKARLNIVVSGGTGVGKTTFLNLLLQEIGVKERVITIEDTKELSFDHPNSVSLIAALNRSSVQNPLKTKDLIKNALRMYPTRIIVGEVRGAEAFDLLQAMNTGHDGSMTTVHANNPVEALSRLESLFTYAGYDVPLRAIRKQLSVAVDFIVQLGKSRSGDRIIKEIYEVTGMEGDVIVTQKIGDIGDNGPVFTGLVPKNIPKLVEYGLDNNFFINI